MSLLIKAKKGLYCFVAIRKGSDRVLKATVITIAACAFATAASAEKTPNRPELFTKLLDCRAIADSAQRLACYDQSVGAVEEAEKKKDLVVVDRKGIRETRKSLFGFTLPNIGLFTGDKGDDKDEISEISGTVESVRRTKGGDWAIRVSNDLGTWETNSELVAPPKVGQKVRITKATLGSYLGQVGLSRGVRFRRVQ